MSVSGWTLLRDSLCRVCFPVCTSVSVHPGVCVTRSRFFFFFPIGLFTESEIKIRKTSFLYFSLSLLNRRVEVPDLSLGPWSTGHTYYYKGRSDRDRLKEPHHRVLHPRGGPRGLGVDQVRNNYNYCVQGCLTKHSQ